MKNNGSGDTHGRDGRHKVGDVSVNQVVRWSDLQLKAGDVIELETLNTNYRFKVMDVGGLRIEVSSDGKVIKGSHEMVFDGTIMSQYGGVVIPKAFVLGLGVKLSLVPEEQSMLEKAGKGPRYFMLTATQGLTLNGEALLPKVH